MTDEKLLEAALLIENNFGQGSLQDGHGRLCLVGAVNMVYTGKCYASFYDGELGQSMNRLRLVIPKCGCCDKFPNFFGAIPHWNDKHCDSGVQAAKLLREAAEVAL